MRFCLGHLRLSPRDAWSMTLVEYDAAQRGYLEARGIDRRRGMTRSRLDELKTLYPDRPASP